MMALLSAQPPAGPSGCSGSGHAWDNHTPHRDVQNEGSAQTPGLDVQSQARTRWALPQVCGSLSSSSTPLASILLFVLTPVLLFKHSVVFPVWQGSRECLRGLLPLPHHAPLCQPAVTRSSSMGWGAEFSCCATDSSQMGIFWADTAPRHR